MRSRPATRCWRRIISSTPSTTRRIIMAYREQLQQPGDMGNGNGQRMRAGGRHWRRVRRRRYSRKDSTIPSSRRCRSKCIPQRQRAAGGYDGNRNEATGTTVPIAGTMSGFRSDRDRDRDRDRGEPRHAEAARGAPARQQERRRSRRQTGSGRAASPRPVPAGAAAARAARFLRRPVRRARSEKRGDRKTRPVPRRTSPRGPTRPAG